MNDEEGTDERAYIQYFLSNIRCPVCDHRYDRGDILDFGRRGDMWLMVLSCPECDTRGLVVVVVKNEPGVAKSLTEFTPEELFELEERGVITADDVLDFHEFLKDFRGDMAELLDGEP